MISKAINNEELVVGLFLDISKAFDSIDRNILIQKLENTGIRFKNLIPCLKLLYFALVHSYMNFASLVLLNEKLLIVKKIEKMLKINN